VPPGHPIPCGTPYSCALGDRCPSQWAGKHKLLELVKGEDPKHPLRGQKLMDLLTAHGIQVARQTVANYRIELGIPSSIARKR